VQSLVEVATTCSFPSVINHSHNPQFAEELRLQAEESNESKQNILCCGSCMESVLRHLLRMNTFGML